MIDHLLFRIMKMPELLIYLATNSSYRANSDSQQLLTLIIQCFHSTWFDHLCYHDNFQPMSVSPNSSSTIFSLFRKSLSDFARRAAL